MNNGLKINHIFVDECKKCNYLKHSLTGNTGVFVKEYYATGHGYLTQIKLNDGRIYYAPSSEFQTVKH